MSKQTKTNTQNQAAAEAPEQAIQLEDGTKVALGHFKVTDPDTGDVYTEMDVAEEAEVVTGLYKKAKDEDQSFAKHFLMLAMQCRKHEVFQAVCKLVEERKKWGIAPKGTEASERRHWTKAPDKWKVYKAKILRAMDNGITIGEEREFTYTLPKPDKDGNKVKTVKKAVNSISLIDKALADNKKQDGETKTNKDAAPGVHVNPDGTHDIREAQAQRDIEDLKTMGGVLDPELPAMLSEILDLMSRVSEDDAKKAKDTLKRLRGRLRSAAPETVQEAGKVVNG